MTARPGSAGFTLVELLVALAVFGLVMLGLTAGLRFGIAAYDRQARALDAAGDLGAVDNALRRLVARMEPGDPRDGTPLAGTDRTLEWVSVLPDAADALPVRRAALALGTDALGTDGTGRLILRWVPRPYGQPLGPPPQPEQSVLLRGVASLRIAYLPPGPGAGWTDRWPGPALPRLVRFHIAFPAGDPRRWPDIVAAPAAASG